MIHMNIAVTVIKSASSEEEAGSSEKETEPSTSAWLPNRRRGTISVVTRDVATPLDRTKTSSRNTSHILSALAASNLCAAPAGELIISPSAIHQARKDNRDALAAEIRESFYKKCSSYYSLGRQDHARSYRDRTRVC